MEENQNMKFENEPKDENEKMQMELEKQIQEKEEKNKEFEDRIKRLMAEFDNFKKRSEKERSNLYNSLIGDIILKMLPVMDNLEKAVEIETEDEKYKEGIILVLKQFQGVLIENGVKEIPSIGEKFDPILHEAISLVEDENLGEKIIKEEFRKGYTLGDKVLRHSLVVVAN